MLLFVEHEWKILFACDHETHLDVIGDMSIGDTKSIIGLYTIIAILRELAKWSLTESLTNNVSFIICIRLSSVFHGLLRDWRSTACELVQLCRGSRRGEIRQDQRQLRLIRKDSQCIFGPAFCVPPASADVDCGTGLGQSSMPSLQFLHALK